METKKEKQHAFFHKHNPLTYQNRSYVSIKGTVMETAYLIVMEKRGCLF